jgi:hypothetical protein
MFKEVFDSGEGEIAHDTDAHIVGAIIFAV